ncbi:hypothetical protein ACLF95_05830 [Helicobacter pylori]
MKIAVLLSGGVDSSYSSILAIALIFSMRFDAILKIFRYFSMPMVKKRWS